MLKKSTKYSEGNTKPPRSKNYCFTSFQKEEPQWDDKMTYLCYGKEVCPTTQKEHWQGFVCFKNQIVYSGVQKSIGDRVAHVEIIKGTLADNKRYCTKEGNYKEFGELPKQGARHDLNDIKERIIKGDTVDKIAMEDAYIYHQYGRTLNKIEDIVMRNKERTTMTKGIWYYGKTGTGKSHRAIQPYEIKDRYIAPNDNGWFDGYTQQKVFILNDFRGEIPYNQMLQLVDKWPYSLKRRGREPIPFISELVIITSSLPPELVYHNRQNEDMLEQLLRRFEVIECCNDAVDTEVSAS